MRGMGTGMGYINQLGFITILFGFILWVVPSIGLIAYFRNKNLKALMRQQSSTLSA
jgi:hypothetical protein